MKKYLTLIICLLTINIAFSQKDSSRVSLKPDEVIVNEDSSLSFAWREKDQVPLIIEHILKSEEYDTLNVMYINCTNALNTCRVAKDLAEKTVEKSIVVNKKQEQEIDLGNNIIKEQKKMIDKLSIKVVGIPIVVGVGSGIIGYFIGKHTNIKL